MGKISTQILEDFAKRELFDAVGVCEALPVEKKYADKFLEWVNSQNSGALDYMKRNIEVRLNPQLLLEGAKSVIGFRANFWRTVSENRIATYAQGKDYHIVLKEKLFRLNALLSELGGTQKLCVDSTPLMEKYFAQKCGLGFIGKNSLLISRPNGAFNFLCFAITTLEFDRLSQPINDSCRDCDICIRACPVKAINGNYTVNAAKCINALTIEEAKPVKIGNRDFIFGCDICLRVCPKNEKSQTPKMPEFCNRFDNLSETATLESLMPIAKNTPMERTIKKLLRQKK